MSQLKNEISSSDFEVDVEDHRSRSKLGLVSVMGTLRAGLTVLALVAGAAVLGLGADSLAVYHSTSLPEDYMLPLWPTKFDTRPTSALIACGAIVAVISAVALPLGKVPAVRVRHALRSSISLAAPVLGLIVAIVAVSLFHVVDGSTDVDTIQSWSCRWGAIDMDTRPKFGTLCKESRAALTLATLLVPIEALIIGVAGYEAILLRRVHQGPNY